MSDAYVIEAMLLRWADTNSGRTVTFLLPDNGDQHPFKGLKYGSANGQRLALSVALISDDETTKPHEPASQAPQKPADEPKANGGSSQRLSNKAHWLCQEGAFTTYLIEKWPDCLVTDEDGEVDVVETLRICCRVTSRKEFDTNPEAGVRFRNLAAEYATWLQGLD